MKKYLLLIPILILFGCKHNSNTKENNPDINWIINQLRGKGE